MVSNSGNISEDVDFDSTRDDYEKLERDQRGRENSRKGNGQVEKSHKRDSCFYRFTLKREVLKVRKDKVTALKRGERLGKVGGKDRNDLEEG